MKPLTKKQKFDYAKSIGLDEKFFKNPAFKFLGVDYIADYYEGKDSANLPEIHERVDAFSKLH